VNRLPDRISGEDEAPDRRLSSAEFELVIRRASELQARAAEEGGGEGVSEAEVVRIGRELGLSSAHLQRALAEVQTRGRPNRGALDRMIGDAEVRAGRTVPGSADEVLAHLERYLVVRERLAVVRRVQRRLLLQRARGMDLVRVLEQAASSAGLGPREPQVGAGFKLRSARQVQAAVQPLEDGFCHVVLAADLRPQRTGAAAAGAAVGAAASGAAAAFLGIAIDPVAALLGLPLLAPPVWGARAVYGSTVDRAQLHLESILDCLERGEPLVSPQRGHRSGR
jgi:hypothetical protein